MNRKFILRWLASYALGTLTAVLATILLLPAMLISAVGSGGLGAWLWSMMVVVPFGASASFFQVMLLHINPELGFQWVVLSSLGWASGAIAAVSLPEITPLDAMSPALWYLFWLLLGVCVGTAQWLALPHRGHSVSWVVVSLVACMTAALLPAFCNTILAALLSLIGAARSFSLALYMLDRGLQVLAVVLTYSLVTGIGFTKVYQPRFPGAA